MMKKQLVNLSLAAACLMAVGCSVSNEGADYEALMGYDTYYDENVMLPTGSGDQFSEFADNPFVKTSQQNVSTFSVDADGASYAILRRYLNEGRDVNPSSVHIEELLNYFTFDYASPTGNHTVAINAEVGECPWNPQHRLLRLGIKGKELTKKETPRANFVFLVDVSGSMAVKDKLDLLKSGLKTMLSQMNPDDRISLITYSGEVKKLLESTQVREEHKIVAAINKLNANGYTNGGEALKMAYEEAIANYDPKCNNRIILGTDGDFNFGITSTSALTEMVEGYAKKGIYLTCLGFGTGNLNDEMMESISNHGNGTYHYIDSEEEMMKVFVHERERFVSVANDAKCQVTFDSKLISEYRLIGYENRMMSNDDFKDDKKDAGEIGAGQTITALYELVLSNDLDGKVGKTFVTFDFRYKKSLDAESFPLQKTLEVEHIFNKNGRSHDFYFAAGVAAYGMVLRHSPYKGDATIDMAQKLVSGNLGSDPHGYRAKLLELMDKAK
ncbi:MAG: VWA domain-containing protein [Prevotella sp.]|nr:VWA domain-containing protein [Prevotella sp.]